MKKRFMSLLLALVMCLSLLPAPASAAEANLPDWYFLFAIFKNVDASGKDMDGKTVSATYFMTPDEVNIIRDNARVFEEYMNSLGVMRAHVDVLEIDETLTDLHNRDSGGSYIGQEQAAPLLEKKVDLDRYDHVTCVANLNIRTSYGGITSSEFENGAGHSCLNCASIPSWASGKSPWTPGYPVHEFLHFMERLNKKWGKEFKLHTIMEDFYERVDGEFEECYTDVLLNRAKGTAGTGVHPITWQYPPHVLRTMTELTVPSSAASIGHNAFLNYTNLTSVTIPSSVTHIDSSAFNGCTGLTSITIPSSLTSIEEWTFANCSALTRISIPSSVTSIGGAAFQKAGVTDVYYAGTEAQWKAIDIGGYNSPLNRANIHCNHLMADVKTADWFAQPVIWALEQGITAGTGGGAFSPNADCTQGQILTFLWRAKGSPKPNGAVKGGEYYAGAVQWAKEQGLVDGAFSAGSPCTRATAVTYLWKLAGSPSVKVVSFSDVPASASYAGAVSWAMSKGITAGIGGGAFSPDSTCTRGQIVSLLYRALG